MKRRVLVAGGTGGCGSAIVKTLVASGFAVDLTYNSSEAAALALQTSLNAVYPDAVTVRHCDLSSASASQALAALLNHEDRLYYGLVYNAGTSLNALAATANLAQAHQLFELNFWGMAQLVQALVRPMTANKAGRIVLVGSVAASRGMAGNAFYSASKAALEGYMRSLVQEVARRGVTVNCVAPGYVNTDLIKDLPDGRITIETRIPMRRYGSPDEIAAVVHFLLSDAASYVNGSTITVDGGLSTTTP